MRLERPHKSVHGEAQREPRRWTIRISEEMGGRVKDEELEVVEASALSDCEERLARAEEELETEREIAAGIAHDRETAEREVAELREGLRKRIEEIRADEFPIPWKKDTDEYQKSLGSIQAFDYLLERLAEGSLARNILLLLSTENPDPSGSDQDHD